MSAPMTVTIEEAASWALALPETSETLRWNNRTWVVRGKAFA